MVVRKPRVGVEKGNLPPVFCDIYFFLHGQAARETDKRMLNRTDVAGSDGGETE
jgi:hypothetical protein